MAQATAPDRPEEIPPSDLCLRLMAVAEVSGTLPHTAEVAEVAEFHLPELLLQALLVGMVGI